MLLYPTVESDPNLHYKLHDHRVSICMVDLSKDWRDIHRRLIDLVIGPESGVRGFKEEEERGVKHELNAVERDIERVVGPTEWWEAISIRQGKNKEQLMVNFDSRKGLKKLLLKILEAL